MVSNQYDDNDGFHYAAVVGKTSDPRLVDQQVSQRQFPYSATNKNKPLNIFNAVKAKNITNGEIRTPKN